MRKLITSILLGLALLVPSDALAATASVTISHPGTRAQLTALARSFVKENLLVVNDHVGRTRVVVVGQDEEGNDVTQVKPFPFTEADIDAASAARINRAVAIILQDFFEAGSYRYDLAKAGRDADLSIVTPVRDRGRQTTIDNNIDP